MVVSVTVTGGQQLAALGPQLRAAPARIRYRLRRNLTAAAAPIKADAQTGYQAGGQLGSALANATSVRVRTGGRGTAVQVRVDGSKMPPTQQGLPPLVEGIRRWRKPLFGNREHWYDQAPAPELTPAFEHGLPGAQAAVIAAVEQTARELAAGL